MTELCVSLFIGWQDCEAKIKRQIMPPGRRPVHNLMLLRTEKTQPTHKLVPCGQQIQSTAQAGNVATHPPLHAAVQKAQHMPGDH